MARPIKVGDTVAVLPHRVSVEMEEVYGNLARRPFVVERVQRNYRYIAIYGGGLLVWRKDCKRVK